jgi:hypothetical protein
MTLFTGLNIDDVSSGCWVSLCVHTVASVSNEKLQKCCYWLFMPIFLSLRVYNKLKNRGTDIPEISYCRVLQQFVRLEQPWLKPDKYIALSNYTHRYMHIYILFKKSKIYIKTFKTLLHVSITRSSSGSIYCSLLKL